MLVGQQIRDMNIDKRSGTDHSEISVVIAGLKRQKYSAAMNKCMFSEETIML